MPRFNLKTMLIVFAIAALWFSTFTNYTGASDVRACVMFAALICSGVAAWSHTKRRQAFWIGFSATLLLAFSRMLSNFGPSFQWASQIARTVAEQDAFNPRQQGRISMALAMTLYFAVILIAATVIGMLCMYVYDQCKKSEQSD